jgi:hypothetical protein
LCTVPVFSPGLESSDLLPQPLEGVFRARTRQNVRLGPLRVAFRSNESSFAELQHFPEGARLPHEASVHHTVNCCNLSLDGPWPLQQIQDAHDTTYRGKRFAAGYYLTDHFGSPAYLITRAKQLWIFAPHFGPILWPFVVKFLLTTYAIDQRMLHLKAAAVSLSDIPTLLVGRGGTGKTVLLTQLCQKAGAQFLANTHVLVHDGTALPIASTMRVRNDWLFGPMIAARGLPSAVKAGEYLADPFADLGWKTGTVGPIRNICLVDFRGSQHRALGTLDRNILFDYMENFSLALNIYGLREDVLDYLDGDASKFSTEWTWMKTRLRALVGQCRCYYISCDVTDPDNLHAVGKMLGAAEFDQGH